MENIKRLVEKLASFNQELEKYPGEDKKSILLKFNNAGITPNEFILDLLSWSNGIEELNAFTRLLDVDSAIEVHAIWKELKESAINIEELIDIPETIIPLIDVNGDFQYGVDTLNNAVFFIDMELGACQKICPDYNLMIDAIDRAIETDVFTYDQEGGYFECDEEKWQNIADQFQIEIL